MKKREALAIFNLKIFNGNVATGSLISKKGIEREIRMLSDNDESFENAVFELGCSELAKTYLKRMQQS